MLVRLRSERVVSAPKPVIESIGWRDHTGTLAAAKNPALPAYQAAMAEVLALVAMRRAIVAGGPIPEGCYRKGLGTTPDPLLVNHGIMHLHLGSPRTRTLLYLIQYADRVVFLELNDHKYVQMARLPSSQNLLAVHGAWLKALENQAATAAGMVKPP